MRNIFIVLMLILFNYNVLIINMELEDNKKFCVSISNHLIKKLKKKNNNFNSTSSRLPRINVTLSQVEKLWPETKHINILKSLTFLDKMHSLVQKYKNIHVPHIEDKRAYARYKNEIRNLYQKKAATILLPLKRSLLAHYCVQWDHLGMKNETVFAANNWFDRYYYQSANDSHVIIPIDQDQINPLGTQDQEELVSLDKPMPSIKIMSTLLRKYLYSFDTLLQENSNTIKIKNNVMTVKRANLRSLKGIEKLESFFQLRQIARNTDDTFTTIRSVNFQENYLQHTHINVLKSYFKNATFFNFKNNNLQEVDLESLSFLDTLNIQTLKPITYIYIDDLRILPKITLILSDTSLSSSQKKQLQIAQKDIKRRLKRISKSTLRACVAGGLVFVGCAGIPLVLYAFRGYDVSSSLALTGFAASFPVGFTLDSLFEWFPPAREKDWFNYSCDTMNSQIHRPHDILFK